MDTSARRRCSARHCLQAVEVMLGVVILLSAIGACVVTTYLGSRYMDPPVATTGVAVLEVPLQRHRPPADQERNR
jgi:hypothetical protein